MKNIGGLVVFCLVGCGAAHAVEPRPREPEPADAAVVVPDANAVGVRLDTLPAFDAAWARSLGSMSDDLLAQLYVYERANVNASEVEADCGDGRHAVVGRPNTTLEARVEGLRVVGAACEITVGDLVACELAVREQPCAYGGAGLPECVAIDRCHDHVRDELLQIVTTHERVVQYIRHVP